MRLHTDKPDQVIGAIHDASARLDGVYATLSRHGSRSRAGAVELSLEGNGYPVNTGTRGAGAKIGATWDEWGVVLAAVFNADPEAFAGSQKHPVYAGAEDFARKTCYRFDDGQLPEDTHRRHDWSHGMRYACCTKCTAEREW